MASSHSQAPDADGDLKVWSCVTCRRRKVKCDRRDPCANCAQRQAELLGRLRRLEDLVAELSGQLEDAGRAPGSGVQQVLSAVGSSGRSSEPALTSASAGRMSLTGTEEIYPEDVPVAAHCHGYVFGTPCATATQDEDLYPLPSQVPFLWKTYVDRVDPFIKILHVPSVEAIIALAKGKLSYHGHGAGTEALLFAVCLTAVASLDADEVSDGFRVSRGELVTRLRLGTERALGLARFATTRDVTVVQALAIYLFILPHIGEAQLAFNLAGVLVKLATSAGLHKDPLDGTSPDSPALTDVAVETRRRLWWHIVFLDSRGQASGMLDTGLTISEDSFTTRIPSNADDQALAADIPAARTEAVAGKRGVTQSTLSIIRCHIWRLRTLLRRSRDQPLESQLQRVLGARGEIEGTFLSEPTTTGAGAAYSSFLSAITGLFFAKIEAEICRQHLLRRQVGQPDLNPESLLIHSRFFAASVSVLETTRDLCSNPAWHSWRWQLQGSFPWRVVGSVFAQLCRMPSWTPVSERAWGLARELLDGLPDGSKGQDMWRRLDELAERAGVHRRRQMQMEHRPLAAPVTGSEWELVVPQGESEMEKGASAMNYIVASQEGTLPRLDNEPQASLVGGPDVLTGTPATDWEPDIYAVDESLAGWLDWDDLVDMDMLIL
ncbi:b55d031e-8cf0-4c1d-b063-085358105129 [Thermothielavioides terrestris]|uniref:B55d031e-8cf0-4c1d-b063-085358105129 n=1 Tax=Thermothielavioides terrestris TaxID=2587410 RepID=A0A3S4AN03_9PEZI|nr:b55d031e-8cf0-4c1d-b063-085358105129 [Thermothielavioides terrestris]